MKNVVIIGNGISGITAARNIRKLSNSRITVISSESPYFFSRTALMYVYMGHLTFENTKPYEDGFWKKNRIELVYDHAENVDIRRKTIHLRSGKDIPFDTLIIACGSRSNFVGWAGEDLDGVQALYSCRDLQRMEASTRGIRNAVVVGGGLIGVEMAEMLCARKINVTLLVREPAFWSNVLPLPEANLISRHIASHGVSLRHEVEMEEIISGEDRKVKSVRTKSGEEIPCDFVGIAVGVSPNVGWLKDSGIATKNGILVNEFLETNIPGIYAIGDCVERTYPLAGRKNIEQVWYTARMMGEVVAQTVCGDKTQYSPGPWFNSAKFFDIEYQTYGIVDSELQAHHKDFYWEHASGRKALHLVWEKQSRKLIGINTFGIRLRHALFDQWLRQGKSIDFVVDHLAEANFDPEFSERHEEAVRRSFVNHN